MEQFNFFKKDVLDIPKQDAGCLLSSPNDAVRGVLIQRVISRMFPILGPLNSPRTISRTIQIIFWSVGCNLIHGVRPDDLLIRSDQKSPSTSIFISRKIWFSLIPSSTCIIDPHSKAPLLVFMSPPSRFFRDPLLNFFYYFRGLRQNIYLLQQSDYIKCQRLQMWHPMKHARFEGLASCTVAQDYKIL